MVAEVPVASAPSARQWFAYDRPIRTAQGNASASTRQAPVHQREAQGPALTRPRELRKGSTVSFGRSGSSNPGASTASDLKLAALLKLCASDDQGVPVEWPDGLDYLSALELLEAHGALDIDEVLAWKRHGNSGPSPPASAAAGSSSGDGEWSAQELTDLIELHEDGLPVRWPVGLNLTVAKELLHRLSAYGPG